MTQTTEQTDTNGQQVDAYPPATPVRGGGRPSGDPSVTPAKGTGTPSPPTGRDGKALPEKTKVDLDLSRRLMIEEYADWYYPVARPTSDEIVHELIGIAYSRAKKDQQRAETPADRIARMGDS